MKKIVINACHGGFGLSDAAIERYLALKDIKWVAEAKTWSKMYYHAGFLGISAHFIDDKSIERDDATLIQVVEELGYEANSRYSMLEIIEIPDDVEWVIHEYDGLESIHEKHRVWS